MRLLANRFFGLLAIILLALAAMELGRLRPISAGIFFAGMIFCCWVILYTDEP